MTRIVVVGSFCLVASLSLASSACNQEQSAARKELPKENYDHPAEEPHEKSDYFFKLAQMPSFYRVPGEFGHKFEG